VLCVDEKTGMQAFGRKHSTQLPEPARAGRFECEHVRRGTRPAAVRGSHDLQRLAA
jgi:hypothetical protein